jgi:hypothetical protein
LAISPESLLAMSLAETQGFEFIELKLTFARGAKHRSFSERA